MTAEQPDRGTRMATEIAEQPTLLGELVAARSDIATVAAEIAANPPRFVLLAARGSSDHAALYAKYLIEILLGIPAGLVSPSATTLYGAQPDLRDVLLISISQSGGSPDLLEVTHSARRHGARTVALTNTPGSPLHDAAELAIDIRAGRENAVAATKTYTNTLLALYLFIDALRGGDAERVRDIGTLAERTLTESTEAVGRAAREYRFVNRVVTSARGYSYASAAETALKLAETSYLSARAYSGADLLHGPVAAVDEDTAVLALTSQGAGGDAMREVLDTVSGRGADVLAIGSAAADMPVGGLIPVPACAEEVAPILEILPAQRLTLELALARGGDPDQPRGLHKVTKTL